MRSFKLYRVYLAKLEFSLKFQGEGTFRLATESHFASFLRQMCTERCFAHKTIDVSRMPIYRARTRARFISIFPRFCCCCRRSCLTYLFSFRQHPYTLHSSNNDNDIGDDDVYFFLLQKLYCKHYKVVQCITKQDSEYINK